MGDVDPKDPFKFILTKVQEGVRKSQLMLSFHSKLADAPAGGFAFATEFEKLCEAIVPQIGEIKTLFPEFTPHDEKLHITNLFVLADKFFEGGRYDRLNVAEMFLLAASLYAHDWGMAIGGDEKAYLASGGDPSLLRDTFVPLPDERQRLQAFARSEGSVSDDSNKVAFTLSDSVLPLPAIHVNLPSETPPPNLARTSLGAESENWDRPILTAFPQRLADTQIKDALALNPAERLFRLGWIETVFRIGAQPLATVVPESTTPTLWFVSPGKLEIREDGFMPGTEVCIVPEEVLDVLHALVLKRFACTSLTLPDIQWEGPQSLLWQFEDQRSKPVLNGAQLATHWAAARLVPTQLQFLQPPNAVAQLLRQTVCTSIEATIPAEIQKEIHAGADARRALLGHPSGRTALELARDDALHLTAEHRDLLHRIFPFLPKRNPSVLPVAFAAPFNEYPAAAEGDFNVLHKFGQGLCGALGALGIAEADGHFTMAELEKLHRDCVKHRFWFEFNLTFDVEKFSAWLFKIVIDRGFMPGFQPPILPKPEEYVPNFPRNTDSRVFGVRGRYFPANSLGAFGAPIKKWP
jgi:hypothetical protein